MSQPSEQGGGGERRVRTSSDSPDAAATADSSRVKRVSIQHTLSFEGPLPPPSILEAYNRVVPNGAERLFAAFEQQVKHRQALESTVVTTNSRLQVRGFYAALSISGISARGVHRRQEETRCRAGLETLKGLPSESPHKILAKLLRESACQAPEDSLKQKSPIKTHLSVQNFVGVLTPARDVQLRRPVTQEGALPIRH